MIHKREKFIKGLQNTQEETKAGKDNASGDKQKTPAQLTRHDPVQGVRCDCEDCDQRDFLADLLFESLISDF